MVLFSASGGSGLRTGSGCPCWRSARRGTTYPGPGSRSPRQGAGRWPQPAAAARRAGRGACAAPRADRRIREDLIRLGIVSGGPAVTIASGTRASPGDLIICTRNDHTVEAGEPGQRRPAPDRSHHPGRPDRPPGPGRRPADRAAPLDRPTLLVQPVPGGRTGLRGHRPRRPGPHRAHRPSGDHRHRGLNRPGFCGGSQSTGEWDDGSSTEVSGRAA